MQSALNTALDILFPPRPTRGRAPAGDGWLQVGRMTHKFSDAAARLCTTVALAIKHGTHRQRACVEEQQGERLAFSQPTCRSALFDSVVGSSLVLTTDKSKGLQ
jgi:hypothetical protein